MGEDESESLPLIARLRPRGHTEDNWTARPSEGRPWPVILVHGTGDTPGVYQEMAHELRGDGWAVFAPGYGQRATRPLQESAHNVGAYIDAVLKETGAEKAIVVGHSQGGLVVRYWMRFHGGAAKVHHLVCLATPNHGTTMGGVISPLIKSKLAEDLVDSLVKSWFGPAGFQQVIGSPFIEALNDGGDLDEEVEGYTCIATRSDSVIQPPETCFLKGENVRNLWVQDLEPRAVILHEDMPRDKRVRRLVMAVLRGVALADK
ncbi:lipase [Corynebacterium doosanense CAU 212 = DSM 45436]|uniref:Lipase n=2 Tax=Corynebacterium TaxID=1716 RepID=A0A097ICV0_9CORY|nr:lipase [Corynebacterium doosanense CAU 212 = DSM 45436]